MYKDGMIKLLSKHFASLITNKSSNLLDLVCPIFNLSSHAINLLLVKNTGLHPSNNNQLIYLVNGSTDKLKRQCLHHQMFNLMTYDQYQE